MHSCAALPINWLRDAALTYTERIAMEETKVNLLSQDTFVPPQQEPRQRLVPPSQPEPQQQKLISKSSAKKKQPPFMYFVCRRTLLLGSSLYI